MSVKKSTLPVVMILMNGLLWCPDQNFEYLLYNYSFGVLLKQIICWSNWAKAGNFETKFLNSQTYENLSLNNFNREKNEVFSKIATSALQKPQYWFDFFSTSRLAPQ